MTATGPSGTARRGSASRKASSSGSKGAGSRGAGSNGGARRVAASAARSASVPASAHRKAARKEQRQVRRLEGHRRRKARRSFLWRWRRPLYVLTVLVVAGLIGLTVVVSRVQLPTAATLEQTSYICSAEVDLAQQRCAHGNELASLQAGVNRELVTYDHIPQIVVQAVISAEDREYFRHGGVDPFGVARALVRDLQNHGDLQGGSTITQQYVKNAFLSQERTLSRKLKEAVLAVKLDRARTKEDILTAYLNTIYFGRGAYGVQAASNAYFGHGIEFVGSDYDSTATSAKGLAKAAYLAGLIRSPETADVYFDPEEAEFRRDSVLRAMVEEGYITADQMAQAEQIAMKVVDDRTDGYVQPRLESADGTIVYFHNAGAEYFVDAVRQWLVSQFGAQQAFGGGLRVYTTLDRSLQDAAYSTIYGRLESAGPPVAGVLAADGDPAGSLVAIDERGQVLAMVGGKDFSQSQVNLATGQDGGGSGRQPGSTFKPFALAAAIEDGLSPLSTFPAPQEVIFAGANDGKDWDVTGGASSSGRYNLLDATAQSSNTVYAQLMLREGAPRVVELANAMGISAELQPVPALVLGAGEVSVLDMATSYSTLANRGSYVASQLVNRVEDSDGNVLWSAPAYEPKRVLRLETADAVTTALAQVISDGTGTQAKIPNQAAGKTGTTEDYRDAWFVGYSCRGAGMLTAAVWMGYPGTDGQPVTSMVDLHGVERVGGGTFPAQIWSRFMTEATKDTATCTLPTSTKFPGERTDIENVDAVKGTIPAGAFRTTTTEPPTTTSSTTSSSTVVASSSPSSPSATTIPGDDQGGGTGSTVPTTGAPTSTVTTAGLRQPDPTSSTSAP